jgi:hypothetical protein
MYIQTNMEDCCWWLLFIILEFAFSSPLFPNEGRTRVLSIHTALDLHSEEARFYADVCRPHFLSVAAASVLVLFLYYWIYMRFSPSLNWFRLVRGVGFCFIVSSNRFALSGWHSQRILRCCAPPSLYFFLSSPKAKMTPETVYIADAIIEA